MTQKMTKPRITYFSHFPHWSPIGARVISELASMKCVRNYDITSGKHHGQGSGHPCQFVDVNVGLSCCQSDMLIGRS